MKFQCPRCKYITKEQPEHASRWIYVLHKCRIMNKTRELVPVLDEV